MRYSSLSDKIVALNKDFFKSEDSEYEIKYELFRLYSKRDDEGIRKLLTSICLVYEKFYSGYEGFSDAFESAMFELDMYSKEAGEDFLNSLKDSKDIQRFCRKSINYPLNFSLN